MTYWRLFHHLIWSTKQRSPVLIGRNAETMVKSIRATAAEMNAIVHALSVQPDHVYLAISASPKFSPSDVAKQIKGSSSHLLTRAWDDSDGSGWLGWQAEYGVVSFGEGSLSRIVKYIVNQEEHHRTRQVWRELENVGAKPESPPNLEEVS